MRCLTVVGAPFHSNEGEASIFCSSSKTTHPSCRPDRCDHGCQHHVGLQGGEHRRDAAGAFPKRSSCLVTRSKGIGASGLIRCAVPKRYWSRITSPTTRMRGRDGRRSKSIRSCAHTGDRSSQLRRPSPATGPAQSTAPPKVRQSITDARPGPCDPSATRWAGRSIPAAFPGKRKEPATWGSASSSFSLVFLVLALSAYGLLVHHVSPLRSGLGLRRFALLRRPGRAPGGSRAAGRRCRRARPICGTAPLRYRVLTPLLVRE